MTENASTKKNAEPQRRFKADSLSVQVYATQGEMAGAVAAHVHAYLNEVLSHQDAATAILATGNSQIQFLDELHRMGGLEWSRITLFHMDEYLGIAADHPASFRRYLRERVESKMQPQRFHYIEGDCQQPLLECHRYAELLQAQPIDLCCMGIGENGHLAFNDPPVADFNDPSVIKLVRLDDRCKQQQVDEGHFPDLASVPPYAFTLTIPALCRVEKILCVAPEKRKAAAVKQALTGPIEPACPASWLRRQPHAELFLDAESAGDVGTESS